VGSYGRGYLEGVETGPVSQLCIPKAANLGSRNGAKDDETLLSKRNLIWFSSGVEITEGSGADLQGGAKAKESVTKKEAKTRKKPRGGVAGSEGYYL